MSPKYKVRCRHENEGCGCVRLIEVSDASNRVRKFLLVRGAERKKRRGNGVCAFAFGRNSHRGEWSVDLPKRGAAPGGNGTEEGGGKAGGQETRGEFEQWRQRRHAGERRKGWRRRQRASARQHDLRQLRAGIVEGGVRREAAG